MYGSLSNVWLMWWVFLQLAFFCCCSWR